MKRYTLFLVLITFSIIGMDDDNGNREEIIRPSSPAPDTERYLDTHIAIQEGNNSEKISRPSPSDLEPDVKDISSEIFALCLLEKIRHSPKKQSRFKELKIVAMRPKVNHNE